VARVTSSDTAFTVRPALPADVRGVRALVEPYAQQRILLAKEMVGYYEAVQEFVVAEAVSGVPAENPGGALPDGAEPGAIVGCGALHVMWDDLAEIRTLAVDPAWRGRGVGHALVTALLERLLPGPRIP
jgi:amino-acid N-acetyltransferase